MINFLSPFGPPHWKTLTPSTHSTSKKNWKICFSTSPTNEAYRDDRLACNNFSKRAKVLVIHSDGSTELTKVFRMRRILQRKAEVR